MKKIVELTLITIGAIFLFNSCASILSGTKQKVHVSTEPSGARVYVNGKDKNVITPCEIKIPRKKEVTLTFQKTGYQDGSVKEKGKFNSVVLANIILGGIPGFLVDYGTGAWYKYENTNIHYKFETDEDKNDPTIVKGEASNMVKRDKPGETALEKTIIRWFFDSEPRGARLSWRIVSGIPSIVKNTNELYVGNSPYEETRSFNILGLTYENSRDIVIEIKASKVGYEDQVKRYNIRQAIDQQEISGFFELVKKEN